MTTTRSDRRGFLQDVGRGALVAALGGGLANDLGLARGAWPEVGGPERLDFGRFGPLVELLRQTPVERLVPALADQIKGGTPLRDLVAAGALANAQAFAGEDYIGFHTLMALAPSLAMAEEGPEGPARALPIVKVLYRNAARMRDVGPPDRDALLPVAPIAGPLAPEAVREAVRAKDQRRAEGALAAFAQEGPQAAFDALLCAVHDNTEVHRTVLPYRAWSLVPLVGPERALTLLRQSVRYCLKSEREWRHDAENDAPRALLPKLIDEHKLAGRPLGQSAMEDAWVESLAQTIFGSSPEQAAGAAAAALAEGASPKAIGEAIALAANQLVLRDLGLPAKQARPDKPAGSVHGDSIGVHACDSANAWRNMALVSSPRNAQACLVLGAYQVALDRVQRGGDFLKWAPWPREEARSAARSVPEAALVDELQNAIKGNDQERAAVIAERCDGPGASGAFAVFRAFATSEDGSLHAEKYYQTAREEHDQGRPAFRARQLASLGRVTASAHGRPAPGLKEARAALGA